MKIFLVDDEPDAVDTLTVLLANHLPWHIYRAFYSSQLALHAAAEEHPDVVISDIEMAGMNGHHFAKQLTSSCDGTNAPLLIAISRSQAQIRRAEAEGFFNHSILKPVDITRLVDIIERVPIPH